MPKYEFEIQGLYYGTWELETTEETYREAMRALREYRENMPEYAHRLRRVKMTEESNNAK